MSTSRNALPLPSARYLSETQWIADHIAELVARYPNQWVAVHDGRVLGAGRDLDEVAQRAELGGQLDEIVYQFIDDGSLIL